MKKRLLALSLTLALCLGLLVLPAAAAPSLSAYEAVQLLDNYDLPGREREFDAPFHSKFFVDFDQNGVPEMVAVYHSSRSDCGMVLVYYITSGNTVAKATGYQTGMGSHDTGLAITPSYPSSTAYIVRFGNGTYGLRGTISSRYIDDSDTYQYQGNGKFKATKTSSTDFFTLNDSLYHGTPDKYAFFPQPAEPWSPPVPEVPAAPLGSGLTPAPAGAIAALEQVPYYGDRAAITMTRDQASAILGQMAYYASVNSQPDFPGSAYTYAALFDTGAGVPGLFLAKGYFASGSPYVSGSTVVADVGECALWHFKDGQLTLFAPATYSTNYYLYPACVEQDNGAPDGSYGESRYFAMNYGSISTLPANTVIRTEATASVDGVTVSQSKAEEFCAAWQGSGPRAYATQGGGVEYLIYGMAPVADMTAALEGFVAALDAPARTAYPSTQNVSVDGVPMPFQCYALKDAAGNATNYIKLRDIAYVLNGTAAQFAVDWDGAVNIRPGKAYTPNNSEMSTPFSGQRTYAPATAQTLVNGAPANLEAIVLTDDAGGAYTYYKLRDLGAAIGFSVDWSAQRGIYIETK